MAHTLTATSERSVALDNPVWSALTSDHTRFAEGDALARRYHPAVTPLAAIRDQSAEAYRALARLLGPGGVAGLLFDDPPAPPATWTTLRAVPLAQMVCSTPTPSTRQEAIERLGAAAVPAMIELAALTEPGPFGPRTWELGTYLGIYKSGQLVAMAGERVRCAGFAEISAVCTHPDHQGRGYAAVLMSVLMREMAARGETPFLHVRSDNAVAIRVYERLGFTLRRVIDLAVLQAAVA
jgi:GNAT superfamily N-acetyltransferase